ncbi:MAG: sodium:proline symporter, partial [Bacillota bacterium]|nr:sodium:proline symporter [Bacillota bacterium]
GVVVGAAVDIFWLLSCSSTGIYEIIPGFICGGLAGIIAAKATPAPSKAVTDIYDHATDMSVDD